MGAGPRPGVGPVWVLPAVAHALTAGDLTAGSGGGAAALSRKVGSEAVQLLRDGISALEAWRVAKPPVS